MSWNDDTIAMLRELWSKGLSCSQIAQRINSAHGTQFSRNAIIGKRCRSGLPNRTASNGRYAQRRPSKPPPRAARVNASTLQIYMPRPPRDLPPVTEESEAFDRERMRVGLTAIVELEDHSCRWPIGDPQRADFGYCGTRAVPSQPYCKHHTHRAHSHEPRTRRVRPVVANPYIYRPTKSKETV